MVSVGGSRECLNNSLFNRSQWAFQTHWREGFFFCDIYVRLWMWWWHWRRTLTYVWREFVLYTCLHRHRQSLHASDSVRQREGTLSTDTDGYGYDGRTDVRTGWHDMAPCRTVFAVPSDSWEKHSQTMGSKAALLFMYENIHGEKLEFKTHQKIRVQGSNNKILFCSNNMLPNLNPNFGQIFDNFL